MLARHSDIVIPPMDPYRNDKLGRKQYGDVLEQIISTYNGGCVISLNGEWGTGKTTFIKMWKQQLDDHTYKTIYFNAWETDYIEDPLIALIAEFKKLSTDKLQEATKKMTRTFSKMSLAMVPTILSLIAKYSFGVDLEKISKEGLEVLSNTLEQSLDKYIEQKKSIEAFQNALEEYVLGMTPNKPLVFIVDELDRCNPKYAVKVLERIKHLFSVRNVVFVLSVDKKHLCHSICGYYGSESINAQEYLRRFVDLEFTLPQTNIQSFCSYLFEYYSFSEFFDSIERPRRNQSNSEAKTFTDMTTTISQYSNLPLRSIDRLFSNTRLALRMFPTYSNVRCDYLFVLIYLHVCHSELFEQICKRKFSIQNLIDIIIEIFPHELIKYSDTSHPFYLIIGMLIVGYNQNEYGTDSNKLYTYNDSAKEINLNFDPKQLDRSELSRIIQFWDNRFDGCPSLDNYADKIHLLFNLNS
ncbi:MAG: hypothetical protein IKO73_02535 [Bacteroidaceae bacterium]|nr:hypothetical protein [Bacteroidaceae bacterium]